MLTCMIVLHGLLLIAKIDVILGACDVNTCVATNTNTFIQTCKEYTDTMRCMKSKYDTCVGKADSSDILISTQAMQRPTDCQLDMTQLSSSMTTRSDMMSSMWKKQPDSALNPWSMFGGTDTTGTLGTNAFPPFGMMGDMDDGPFDDGPFDDGPFDDGPFDDGPFGMMHPALMMPGLIDTNKVVAPSSVAKGPKKRGGTARQVDDHSSDKNTAAKFTVSTLLLVLLPFTVFITQWC